MEYMSEKYQLWTQIREISFTWWHVIADCNEIDIFIISTLLETFVSTLPAYLIGTSLYNLNLIFPYSLFYYSALLC
jgi:hypothetical protein